MKLLSIFSRAGLLALASAAAISNVAAQQAQTDEALHAEIRGLDVAGIYWGQSEREMLAELAAHGFVVKERLGRGNFDWEVENAVKKLTGGDWVLSDGSGARVRLSATKGSESMEITLALSPSGPRVHSLEYIMSGDTDGIVEAAAVEKYGPRGYVLSRAHMPGGRRYCLKRDSLCPRDHFATYPNVYADDGRIRLEGGEMGDASFVDAFRKAVEARIAPRRPSF